jgi:hypothetical protein
MVPEVFRAIVQTEPEVLLRSDVATAEAKDREALVTSFLNLAEQRKLSARDPGTLRQYGKMLHPGLADQLRPYVTDASRDVFTRRTAIEIASLCEVPDLAHDLAAIALDPHQDLVVREMAARAVRHSNVDEAKLGLKPLIMGVVGDDPKDELKGCALRSLWPDHMTTEELFQVLTPPRRESYLGSYAMFLMYDLAAALPPSDLPYALNWIESQGSSHQASFYANRLIDGIMKKAWDQMMAPGVARAFGRAILSRARQFDKIISNDRDSEFRQCISEDHSKRRMLVGTMISLVAELEEDPQYLLFTDTPLVLDQDIPWMLERLQSTESTEEQLAWAQLIGRAFDQRETEQLEVVYDACQANSVLANEFAWLFQPVDLNSPRAERMKETHNRRENWRQLREQQTPLLDPPPEERMAWLLAECEDEDSAAWWRLNVEMTLEPDSTHYGDEFEPDLTSLPGWKAANTQTRARIVDAAWKYIQEQDAKPDAWLGTSKLYRPAWAGYRAFRLLLKEAPEIFDSIPTDAWKRWAPIILAFPFHSALRDGDPDRLLVAAAYRFAPDDVVEALKTVFGREESELDAQWIIQNLTDSVEPISMV